jgi:hypothetical protein
MASNVSRGSHRILYSSSYTPDHYSNRLPTAGYLMGAVDGLLHNRFFHCICI